MLFCGAICGAFCLCCHDVSFPFCSSLVCPCTGMSRHTMLAASKCPLDTASGKVPVVDTASVEAWEQLQLLPGKGLLFGRREMFRQLHQLGRQKLLIRQSASLEGTWKGPSWQHIAGSQRMLDSVKSHKQDH